MIIKLFVLLSLIVLFNACTYHDSRIGNFPESETLKLCRGFYTNAEHLVVTAKVADSQASRITDFPYLRVNRFLASYRHEVYEQKFTFWVEQLKILAIQGLLVEIANLPKKSQQQLLDTLKGTVFENSTLENTLRKCADLLQKFALNQESEQEKLRARAIAPAQYKNWQRVIGLYPLTALLFKSGIDRWHKQTLQTYAIPLQQLPVKGKLAQYSPEFTTLPLSTTEVSQILKKSASNALNIPIPDATERQRLFDSFAPLFEIDVVSENDHLGSPLWSSGELPIIDTTQPTVYRLLSYTRVDSQVLLQLNYTIWFPSRPQISSVDLLSGYLDGITWRVTLLPNGKPWIYDTIHNCGCYHLFFPTQNASLKPPQFFWTELEFMPQKPLSVNESDRIVMRIAANTHYIQRVYVAPPRSEQTLHYLWADADNLRSLPMDDGDRHSLYDQDGIIPSSARGERYFFWPMGIPNPGAMRQWGNHATAFVGRRHFDDARLFENSFEIVQ